MRIMCLSEAICEKYVADITGCCFLNRKTCCKFNSNLSNGSLL